MKILLDYVFPISVITPTAQASTGFLKQACVVAKPKAGQEANVGTIYQCTTMTQVAARTDNTNSQQLFNAGMSKVYLLLADTLDLEDPMDENIGDFYTVLISDDFTDEEIEESVITAGVSASKKIQDVTFTAVTEGVGGNSISIDYNSGATAGAEVVAVVSNAISVQIEDGVSTAAQIAAAIAASGPAAALVTCAVDVGDESDVQAIFGAAVSLIGGVTEVAGGDGLQVGTFEGVIGVSSDDADFCADQAAIEGRSCFFTKAANGAKNLFYAFGSMLSNASNWRNQQYITMPFNDDVNLLGSAITNFDDKVSFVINDDEYGNRLSLFTVGGKAIVSPYILKNLRIDLQSRSLQWISGNQPQYTKKEAALLETRLQEDVINSYIDRKLVVSGSVEITLVQQNFVATGSIEVPEPKALWRVTSEMIQTV